MAALIIFPLLLAFIILIILAVTKKIRWWWPLGSAVVALIFIAIAGGGGEEGAAVFFGFAGLIIAIATAGIVMSALKSPLSNFLEETIGEGPARVGVIFAYLVVYFAGLKAGASIFQESSSISQEMSLLAFSAVIRAPADVIEGILETIKAPWLILFGILMLSAYVIYQRIRENYYADREDADIEVEGQEESQIEANNE